MSSLWSDIGALRSLSAWLQWISISLVFISGFLQVSKYLVDRREKALSAIEQAEKANPINQLLRSATATVDVRVRSGDDINTQFMDRGGIVALARGTEPLIQLADSRCFARQIGDSTVAWHGEFTMNVHDPAAGRPIRALNNAEYLQLHFTPLTPNSEILGGSVVFTINSSVRIDIAIPAQRMQNDAIIARDLEQLRLQLR